MTDTSSFLQIETPSIDTSFDADRLTQIADAFDQVCGQLRVADDRTAVKDAIAVHIIALARTGHCDATWLRNATLMALEEATSLP